MPQKRMEYFTLLFDHLAWIKHQFLSGIRDSRKAGSLWGMMRGVGGVRKSIHHSWLAIGLGLGLLCWDFKGVQQEILREEASTLEIGSVSFPAGQYTSPQLHPCHRLFEKMGIKTVPHRPYSPDLAPCDFWLFPKLRGYCYETIEEMKEAVTKVIDMLTQEDFHGAFQKLLEWYNKCIAAGGDYFEGDKSFMCVLSIKVPIRKKSGNLFNDPRIYIYIYIYYYRVVSVTLGFMLYAYISDGERFSKNKKKQKKTQLINMINFLGGREGREIFLVFNVCS